MPIATEPNPVPFERLADLLDDTIQQARGGAMAACRVEGRRLAEAIERAGWRVVEAAPGAQLTL